MRKFMHGTDYESALDIVKNGFRSNKSTVWTCSNADMLYVRDADNEDTEYLTIEAGQIAAAYRGSNSTRIGVIAIEMSDELADEIVEDDNSCENTEGCYQILIDDLMTYLKTGDIKVTIEVYDDAYVPYMRAFYLSNLNSEYLQIKDNLLLQAMRVLSNNSVYIEDIFMYGEVVETYAIVFGKAA